MKLQQFLGRQKILLFPVAALFLVGVSFTFLRAQTNLIPNEIGDRESKGLLLYVSTGEGNAAIKSLPLSANAPLVVSDFGNEAFKNHRKQIYLSPNREFVAVTAELVGFEYGPLTYIARLDGTKTTQAHYGYFVSWAPDSSKALLYVSPMERPWLRKIYALEVQDKYYDIGLPEGVISADISPFDGSIAYSLTSGGTDEATIYLRDPRGNERVLVKGDGNIFAWLRWSPRGDRIAILKSDLLINTKQSVWAVNADGTVAEEISGVAWGYPPSWSSDGTRFAFSNAGNIWEYDATQKALRNVTNFASGSASHPSYSADDKSIVFVSASAGVSQVWAEKSGETLPLTSDNQSKGGYPILP